MGLPSGCFIVFEIVALVVTILAAIVGSTGLKDSEFYDLSFFYIIMWFSVAASVFSFLGTVLNSGPLAAVAGGLFISYGGAALTTARTIDAGREYLHGDEEDAQQRIEVGLVLGLLASFISIISATARLTSVGNPETSSKMPVRRVLSLVMCLVGLVVLVAGQGTIWNEARLHPYGEANGMGLSVTPAVVLGAVTLVFSVASQSPLSVPTGLSATLLGAAAHTCLSYAIEVNANQASEDSDKLSAGLAVSGTALVILALGLSAAHHTRSDKAVGAGNIVVAVVLLVGCFAAAIVGAMALRSLRDEIEDAGGFMPKQEWDLGRYHIAVGPVLAALFCIAVIAVNPVLVAAAAGATVPWASSLSVLIPLLGLSTDSSNDMERLYYSGMAELFAAATAAYLAASHVTLRSGRSANAGCDRSLTLIGVLFIAAGTLGVGWWNRKEVASLVALQEYGSLSIPIIVVAVAAAEALLSLIATGHTHAIAGFAAVMLGDLMFDSAVLMYQVEDDQLQHVDQHDLIRTAVAVIAVGALMASFGVKYLRPAAEVAPESSYVLWVGGGRV